MHFVTSRPPVLLHIAHVTSTLNCWWLMGRSSSTLHMSLEHSTANGQWGWVLLHIAHVTLTLNCWWGVLLHIARHFNSQLLMADGVGGPPPHCTYHFNYQLLMANGGVGPPQHHTSHFNSAASDWWGGWGGILHIWHPVSHIIWGWGCPPHLTNRVECTSAVKSNWLQSAYASTA